MVGDIHGHFEQLRQLLTGVRFDPCCDRLFSTGDLVDRGPFSSDALQWLEHPWFHAVRGNHEQMAIDCANGVGDPPRHSRNGGAWFHALPAEHQQRMATALAKLPLAIEIQLRDGRHIGIVHAELSEGADGIRWCDAVSRLGAPDFEVREDARTRALYARNWINTMSAIRVQGIDRLYVGHTTVPQVLSLGNVVYLDTGCSFADGTLTLIEINNERISEYQAAAEKI